MLLIYIYCYKKKKEFFSLKPIVRINVFVFTLLITFASVFFSFFFFLVVCTKVSIRISNVFTGTIKVRADEEQVKKRGMRQFGSALLLSGVAGVVITAKGALKSRACHRTTIIYKNTMELVTLTH